MCRDKIKKGDILVCVVSANSYLKQMGEYKCENIMDNEVEIIDEYGGSVFYNKNRFIKKADIRDININQVLK